MSQRYYWSRIRSGPKAGIYRIFDRVLEIHIAECQFKENAELIVGALVFSQQITSEDISKVTINDQSQRESHIHPGIPERFGINDPSNFHASGR